VQQRAPRREGKKICLDCAGDDPELVRQIIHVAMPEMAQKLEAAITAVGTK
jgi:hypothetical protein